MMHDKLNLVTQKTNKQLLQFSLCIVKYFLFTEIGSSTAYHTQRSAVEMCRNAFFTFHALKVTSGFL